MAACSLTQIAPGILTNLNNLDNNKRVDLNASDATFEQIAPPDLIFILNSLTELSEDIIDTENL